MLARNRAAHGDERRRAEEPDADAGQGEARLIAGDREIAGRRRAGSPPPSRRPRPRRSPASAARRSAASGRRNASSRVVEGFAAIGVVAMRLQFLEIVPGATAPARRRRGRRRARPDRRAIAANAPISASIIARLSALREAGDCSVSVATPPWSSRRTRAGALSVRGEGFMSALRQGLGARRPDGAIRLSCRRAAPRVSYRPKSRNAKGLRPERGRGRHRFLL